MSVRKIDSWMHFWGWSEADGTMLKRDADGIVVAHRGDAVWEADLDRAIERENKVRGADHG